MIAYDGLPQLCKHLSPNCDKIKLHAVFMDNSNISVSPGAGTSTPSDEHSFAEILSEFEQQHANGRSEALQGTVVSITPESVFVDIGRKMDGVLPLEHFRDKNGELGVQKGDRLLVTITGRDSEGSYTL